MDVQKKLDEIVAAVGSARSMPMSASCVINRAELLAQLEEVRKALPGSLAQAQELIGGREQMVEEARREADRIIESAHAQRGSLISDTEVARRSQDEADRILAEARREADEVKAEADDYVDSKLANFEVVLTKTIGSVDRGREKLLGRGPGLDDQGYPDAEAPERSHDPQTQREQADAYVDTKLATFEAVLSKTLEAVGRGRQKLLGRVATDDLGAHMAAQDAAGHQQSRSSSDADFLAGLAEPQAPLIPAQAQAQPEPQPSYDAYAYQQPVQQDAYAYQDPYAGYQQVQQQPDPYAVSYEQQQPDPYGGYQQPQQGTHDQQAALDETSFFDTSMINLDQLRQYEQGR
ncbi:cell division initiation protein [Streptomyces sp. ZAF1911]|uniref:DivIVA domain-containing protein n=1 Tax=unclassified Streptomyces TaxID=2593676 RepID=UPI00203036EE|nr:MULTISPECIES: cell division initiation protein [unclassified Streptomyces]MCM1970212.1 cell division initiation protein [Streptomyces sp. G1]MCX5122243.1 cell division initiation protein [Streptomyces sp. NBC_00347]MDD9379145.1 cell division initiation protein [Streptomyces sp. ZAF1911]